MKKITLVIAGLMFSGAASAALTLPGSGEVLMTDCALLNEDVSINLTAGVVAGVGCDVADNAITLTTCHTSGKTVNRTVGRKPNTAAGAPAGSTVDCVIGAADPLCVATEVNGATQPSASTLQGTVSAQYPGTACTAANAKTTADSLLPQ
jgi:hypothetical protein